MSSPMVSRTAPAHDGLDRRGEARIYCLPMSNAFFPTSDFKPLPSGLVPFNTDPNSIVIYGDLGLLMHYKIVDESDYGTARTRQCVTKFSSSDGAQDISGVALTPDDELLFSSTPTGFVRAYNVANGQQVASKHFYPAPDYIAFAGGHLFVAQGDEVTALTTALEPASGVPASYTHPTTISGMAGRANTLVVTGQPGATNETVAAIFDAQTFHKSLITSFSGACGRPALNRDGSLFAVVNTGTVSVSMVYINETATGRGAGVGFDAPYNQTFHSVAFVDGQAPSPSGEYMVTVSASVGDEYQPMLYSALTLGTHGPSFDKLQGTRTAVSCDGTRLYAVGETGAVQVVGINAPVGSTP